MRASLLQEAPHLIDKLLDEVPSAASPPQWCQVEDHRVTLMPASDLSLGLHHDIDILPGIAGAKVSLVASSGEQLVDSTIIMCWQDTVFRFEEQHYVIPPLPPGEVHTVCVNSHPQRYFLLRVKGGQPEADRSFSPTLEPVCCPTAASHCVHDGCADVLQTSLDNFWIAKSYERAKNGRILHLQEHYGASIQTTPQENDHLCSHCYSNYWEEVLGTSDFDHLDKGFPFIDEPLTLEAIPLTNTAGDSSRPDCCSGGASDMSASNR